MSDTIAKKSEQEMNLYRRRFPFRIPEGQQCVLFEENDELSVKIYRGNGQWQGLGENKNEFISYGRESEESIQVQLVKEHVMEESGASVGLLSETLLSSHSDCQKSRSVYYTLQICDKEGATALFRAFTANETVADRLFERLCSMEISCTTAIDFYREARKHILQELWFYGI